MQNYHFGSKIKIPKRMSKSILQIIYSCSVQKTAPKNITYSRSDSILIIGHHACKGYSPSKILTLAQKLKFQKTCQNPLAKSFRVVLCKEPLQKTVNIREMRGFCKSAIMHAKVIAHPKPHFGSKIKIPKNMSKSIVQTIYSCLCAKNRFKKH